ncbi:MAG: sodium:alanine symporter family protein [Clostridia bacterium]|nr:sodium:alanine symporter family protein [Clostridia bacterium]
MQLLEKIASLLWGPWMLALILGTGIYLTIGTRWLSVTKLRQAFRAAMSRDINAEGDVSGFSALCTSLAATLGTGNIIGVATAIASGGPGALFWMQLAAFFGMATKYAEGYLAVRYRRRGKDGRFLGGPFLYLELGLNRPLLARLFAAACVITCLISMGTTSQINGMVMAAEDFFTPEGGSIAFRLGSISVSRPALLAGGLTTLLVGLVLAGGIRRIASVSTLLVPFMAGLYLLLTVWLLALNLPKLPAATALILHSAFAPRAALGAAAGITLQKAMRYGLGRGIFSNEAGMGSDPIAAATAKTDNPVRQGLISMLGPFLDTVVMCTLTGYAVVVTDAWRMPELNGAGITLYALRQLPLPDGLLSFLYMLCLFFFGFASIIGWSFYGEQSLRYLFPCHGSCVRWFRTVFLLVLFLGSFMTADAVWSLADIFCALMAVPNLIGLICMGDKVFRNTAHYFKTTTRLQ